MARSASWTMVVGSLALLLAVLASVWPVTATLAVLVSEAPAFSATLTVTTIDGYALPATSTSVRVHVGNVVHVQPVPLIAVMVRPAGAVSVTVTVLPTVLSPVPMFDTTNVY